MDNFYYTSSGGGKPLVFLHGWGATGQNFAPFTEHFVSKGFCVLSIDFAGFGHSPAPQTPCTIFDYCDILYKTLLDAGVKKADFICHSFGGRVGILMAAKYPDIVGRLVLVDAAGVRPRRGLKYRLRVWRYKLKKFLVRLKILQASVLENSGSSDYKKLSPVMKQTFISVVNTDLCPYLDKIAAPTLIIFGQNDADTPLYMAKKLHKGIKDSGLIVFPDAGHFSFLDKPKEFKIITTEFLS